MHGFQDLTFPEYWGILRRRIWYFVIPTGVLSAGACIYAWQQAPFYRSETTIQVVNRISPDETADASIQETPQDRMEFVRQLIRSRTFLEGLVEDLHLAEPGQSRDAAATALSASLTFDVLPPHTFKLGYTGSEAVLTWSVVHKLEERIMTLNELATSEVVPAPDPFAEEEFRQATHDLAAAEERFQQFNERHLSDLPEERDSPTLSRLQSQLSAAENDLANTIKLRETTRQRLEEQKKQRVVSPPLPPRRAPAVRQSQRPAPPSGPTELELRLDRRRADLERMSYLDPDRPRVMREVEDLQRRVQQSRELQQQQGNAEMEPPTADDKSAEEDSVSSIPPEVDSARDLAEAELKFELTRLDRLILTKEKNKKELARQLDSALSSTNLPVELAQELNSISQELKSAKDRLATSKLNSELPAKMETNVDNGTFRIIDPANLPQAPSGPNRLRNALLGTIASILLGLGLVVARESLDTTLSDEERASAVLKLPVLTSVPVVRGQKAAKRLSPRGRSTYPGLAPLRTAPDAQPAAVMDSGLEPSAVFTLQEADPRIRAVVLDPGSIAAEQYRLMRTSLYLMQKKGEKLQTILMSSTIANEGKTFTACCLSATLAQELNNKVLLIDAGFRTTSAAKMLGLYGSGPGFSEVLRGEAQLESSIVACADLPFYVLPASATMAVTDLLATPSLEALIRRCEKLFDWVIIDSTPLLASAEASVLLSVCDAALLVVHAGKTPAKLVKETVRRIGEDRIRGIIMNRVRRIAPSRYYGYYYKT